MACAGVRSQHLNVSDPTLTLAKTRTKAVQWQKWNCFARAALSTREHWQAIQFSGNFGRERFVSTYSGQAGEQVDAVGCATKLDHLVGLKEVPRVQRRCVETEIFENRFEPGRISSGWTNKNVEVSRVTRSCMKGDTVRADDDVFNAVGV